MNDRKRIAILTIGTRGDTAPYMALGRTLLRRGHDVTLATLGDYRRTVEDGGLRFVSISDSFKSFLESDVARLYASRSPLDRLRLPIATQRLVARVARELMEGCRTAIRDADIIVHHPILIFAPDIARAYGVPAIMAAPQPLAATGDFPICVTSRRNFGRLLNRATYAVFAIERALVGGVLRRFLRECVVPDAPPGVVPPPAPAVTAMFGYSPSIGPVARDWGPSVAVTGAWNEPPGHTQRLTPDLEAFLAAGPPPVYVGFGSMPWNPRRNRDLIVEAVRLWGGRAVASRGWGGIATDGLPPEIFGVGNVSHAQLFPRVSAVVHHGGAGTTAAGLAAGRPTFVTPILMDQFFWGERVRALGAGPPPVPLATLDAPQLAAMLSALTTDPSYRMAAAAIAARIAKEDGLGAAVAILERALAAQSLAPVSADDASKTTPARSASPLAAAARTR